MPASSSSSSTTTATPSQPPSQEAISARAYQIWEQYGRPDGRDMEIWLEAERQLMGADSGMDKASGGDRLTSTDAAGTGSRSTAPRLPRRQSRAVA